MRPLKAVILKDDLDFVVYQQKVKNILGIEFPTSYLKQGIVRAFLNPQGEIVAGYAIITKGPLRTFSSIPTPVHNLPCDFSELSEVTAMFIDQTIKSGVARLQFWLSFSRDISSIDGITHFMYAYDLEKTKLKKLYSHAKPIVLFEGRTKLLEGMREESDESVEVAKCSTVMFLPLYAMPALLSKLLFRQPVNNIKYFLGRGLDRELRNSA